MLDKSWGQAQDALLHHLPEGTRVLLPQGDWSALPFSTSFYRNTDCNVDLGDHEAILVHKAMLTSFRQADIRLCLNEMAAVFANDVFVLFMPRPRRRGWFLPVHLRKLKAYADPAAYHRRSAHRGAFIHIPKTAGTSIWTRISGAVRSSLYFSSAATLEAFEGDINAFEVVGGHIQAETLTEKGWDGPAFFVLRDPVERVLSFIAHAKRMSENLGMLDESYHTARAIGEGPLNAAQRDLLFHEANMHIRILGERPGDDLHDPATLDQISARAFACLQRPGWSFGLVEQQAMLGRQIAAQFGLGRAGACLPHLNKTNRAPEKAYIQQVRDFLLSHHTFCRDIAFYRSAAQQTGLSAWKGEQRATSWPLSIMGAGKRGLTPAAGTGR